MKKHKIILILLVILILITSVTCILYANRHRFYNLFWAWLDNGLAYERFLDIGHEIEDASWPDEYDKTYIITQYESDKKLEYIKNGEKITLLNSVITHEYTDWKFYVVSSEGYAVIDRNKVARIYTSGKKVSLENVYYITHFEDFEKEEQEIFDSLGFFTKSSKQLGIFLIIACLLIVVLVVTVVILVIKYALKK